MFRMDDDAFKHDDATECTCEYCGEQFPSRTRLFKHLRSGGNGSCAVDPQTGERYLESPEHQPPSEKSRKKSRKHVAFTVTYSAPTGGGAGGAAELERALRSAFPSGRDGVARVAWAVDA